VERTSLEHLPFDTRNIACKTSSTPQCGSQLRTATATHTMPPHAEPLHVSGPFTPPMVVVVCALAHHRHGGLLHVPDGVGLTSAPSSRPGPYRRQYPGLQDGEVEPMQSQ
jgi:hypothetical protein